LTRFCERFSAKKKVSINSPSTSLVRYDCGFGAAILSNLIKKLNRNERFKVPHSKFRNEYILPFVKIFAYKEKYKNY